MTISFIEEDEVQEAIDIINEKLNFEKPKLIGNNVLVRIFIREEDILTIEKPDGSRVQLLIPESIRADERYKQCCALVVDMSEGAKRSNPNYRIGDFIIIPRQEGTQINFRKYTETNRFDNVFHIIEHDKEFAVIRSPNTIKRLK